MEQNKSPRAPQTGEKYVVRFPDGMRDRIAESAKANNRSMNAEIVSRLEDSFATHRVTTTHNPVDKIETMLDQLSKTFHLNDFVINKLGQFLLLPPSSPVLNAESDIPGTKELRDLVVQFAEAAKREDSVAAVRAFALVAKQGEAMGIMDGEGNPIDQTG